MFLSFINLHLRLRCQTKVTSDQTQVERTRCVSRPKLKALSFGSSAQLYNQRSLRCVTEVKSFSFGNF